MKGSTTVGHSRGAVLREVNYAEAVQRSGCSQQEKTLPRQSVWPTPAQASQSSPRQHASVHRIMTKLLGHFCHTFSSQHRQPTKAKVPVEAATATPTSPQLKLLDCRSASESKSMKEEVIELARHHVGDDRGGELSTAWADDTEPSYVSTSSTDRFSWKPRRGTDVTTGFSLFYYEAQPGHSSPATRGAAGQDDHFPLLAPINNDEGSEAYTEGQDDDVEECETDELFSSSSDTEEWCEEDDWVKEFA